MVSVLALLVAAITSNSMQTLRTVTQSGQDTQAKYAAHAGLQTVMNELRQNDRYVGTEDVKENSGSVSGFLPGLTKLKFEVDIWNNMYDSSKAASEGDREPIKADDGVIVAPDTVYLISKGSDTASGQEVLLSSYSGTARRIRPVFADAAYARSKMLLDGAAYVDAWDSSEGDGKYVIGKFPTANDPNPSEGNGGKDDDDGWESPTVKNFEATLGTDAKNGRAARLLGGSRVNGSYRIGPGVKEAAAFGEDAGDSSGDGPTVYGVSTAVTPETQMSGLKDKLGTYFSIDDKATDVPSFVAPYLSKDLDAAPKLDNPPRKKKKKDQWGNEVEVTLPPAPVEVEPGGYSEINVPPGQTLQLKGGVYYFSEEMKVSGKVEVVGSDPVIIFVGKKAVFDGADINKDGSTASLQLCFTDEMKDKTAVDNLVTKIKPVFDQADSGTDSTAGFEAYVRSILLSQGSTTTGSDSGVPLGDPGIPVVPSGSDQYEQGASSLEINGGTFRGSISGKSLVVQGSGGDVFGSMMANIIKLNGTYLHQDLALKGSKLMNAGGWSLESVRQIR